MVQSKWYAKAYIALFTLYDTFQKDKIDKHEFPEVRIIDFGVSEKIKPGSRSVGEAGTVGYRAPEMLLGQCQSVTIIRENPFRLNFVDDRTSMGIGN